MQDFRFGIRMLWRSPGFTVTAVATLALAIGMNTAIFSIVNAVLLKPVHAPEPDRVVMFIDTNKQGSGPLAAEIEFNLWREQQSVLREVSGYRTGSFFLTGINQPEKAEALFVTEDYFRLFDVPFTKGRSFTSEEERPDGPHVVILSSAFWQKAFGGDSHVIGKVISLSGDPYEVIGIVAADVQTETLAPPDIWVPFPMEPNSNSQMHYFQAVGRLNPGVTLKMANAQLQLMTQEFRSEYPNTVSARRGDTYSVQTMGDVLVQDTRLSLLVLVAAVSLVLLIACSNIANLLLVRATTRTREIAIRVTVGASRARIVRQLLVESGLLFMIAASFGLALGLASIRALLVLIPFSIPRVGVTGSNVGADWRVLFFTFAIALITGLLFGLVPALQSSRIDLNSSLKDGGDHGGSAFLGNKARSILIVSEVGLAAVLLIGAALFIRTLIVLRSVSPGFDLHNVLTTRTPIDPTIVKASGIDRAVRNAVQRLTATPGVESAAFASPLPLDGDFNSLPVIVVGRSLNGPSHGFGRRVVVSSGYFDVLRIPLLRGRLFTESDNLDAPAVAIINQEMARELWPDGDPLTDSLLIAKGLGPRFEEPARQIIGIVGDVHDDGLDIKPLPAVFIPGSQLPAARWVGLPVNWVVRTRAQSPSLRVSIQNGLDQVTGGLPAPPLRSMEEVIVRSTASQKFNMLLMTIFGGSALLLAAIGIYGLVSYSTFQRTREIGIRLALGADPIGVRNMVIVQGMRLTLIGIVIGMAGAFELTRFIASMLFGVRARDPWVFVTVPVLLSAVALFSVWLPAGRASRTDPVNALRYE
jgi:putative ABC transport system permease protein